MSAIADLHTHTNYSDGALTPEELLARVKQAGITLLSITDHDSVGGINEAIAIGVSNNITVIPGIELSVTLNQRELHLLGYFFDPGNSGLQRQLAMLREQRINRAGQIVQKLNTLNIPLTLDSVLQCAGKGVVCRPHIAMAMVQQQLAGSSLEVFQKYIGDWGPAYIKKPEYPLAQAVEMIKEAGGLSFLAHPSSSVSEKDLLCAIKTGIDGIETIHPSHTPELRRYYTGIVNQYFLLECGGSDFHGGQRGDEKNLGQVGVHPDTVEKMRCRLTQRSKEVF